jgi:2-polyprenyl-3-methyl-5-hydroxy-6-metoxy-1,4-benzoquinol methylase
MERIHHNTEYWDTYFAEHISRYEFAASYCKGKVVLDAACGTGYGSAHLANSGAKKVIGVDISEKAIEEARRNYGNIENLDFVCLSVHELDKLKQSFDLLISFETIEHIENPDTFLRDVIRILKKGALALISSPNLNYYLTPEGHINPHHLSEMSYETFKRIFSKSFDLKEEYEQSPSGAFMRFKNIHSIIEHNSRQINRSFFLRLDNILRSLFGKQKLVLKQPKKQLFYTQHDDYPIKPLDPRSDLRQYLTFIFVGEVI